MSLGGASCCCCCRHPRRHPRQSPCSACCAAVAALRRSGRCHRSLPLPLRLGCCQHCQSCLLAAADQTCCRCCRRRSLHLQLRQHPRHPQCCCCCRCAQRERHQQPSCGGCWLPQCPLLLLLLSEPRRECSVSQPCAAQLPGGPACAGSTTWSHRLGRQHRCQDTHVTRAGRQGHERQHSCATGPAWHSQHVPRHRLQHFTQHKHRQRTSCSLGVCTS